MEFLKSNQGQKLERKLVQKISLEPVKESDEAEGNYTIEDFWKFFGKDVEEIGIHDTPSFRVDKLLFPIFKYNLCPNLVSIVGNIVHVHLRLKKSLRFPFMNKLKVVNLVCLNHNANWKVKNQKQFNKY
jgi:hypothetical protein